MKALVLDASVCLKWFLPEHNESDADLAQALQQQLHDARIALIQPPVWHSEIAAVLARQLPHHALVFTAEMLRIQAQIDTSHSSMMRAVELSTQLNHHLFDTVYHAVAIEHDIDLVTADEHYYRKAQRLGHIVLLRHWRAPHQVREEPAPYRASARKSPSRKPRKR